MVDEDRDFQRLLALTSGTVTHADGDEAERQAVEEERLFDDLLRRRGTVRRAARKLTILALRLQADGQDEYPEGQRNLALLESALEDLLAEDEVAATALEV